MTTSLHLFSLFSNPSLTTTTTKHTPPPPKTSDLPTTQQRLLVVRGQLWQCHQRHVLPALRCSDANPYLPRQLFHSRAEGMADKSQPAANLSAQSAPSIKENIQSRTVLCPAVNIYCCTKSHPSEARLIFIHLSVTLFSFPFHSKGDNSVF